MSVEEALERILAIEPLPGESVGLARVRGRTLRERVTADRDLPPFDRSMLDGYAVRRTALLEGPVRLPIVGEIPAGVAPDFAIGPREAAAIMTGAPTPAGADCVVKVEDTTRDGNFMEWPAPGRPDAIPGPGYGVSPRASEVRKGTTLLEPGVRLSSAAVGLLATVGHVQIRVGRLPRVAVLSTGDELTHPRTQRLRPGQIRDANSHLIAARCRALGLPTRRLGHVVDEPLQLASEINRGLRADALIVSGGVSMGRFDLVEPALEDQGIHLHIAAVAIRPGKPFVFGTAADGGPPIVFGLPGNPVSALTTFEVLARPALDRLQGRRDPRRPRVPVRLAAPISNRGPRRAFLPARVWTGPGGELVAMPVRSAGSADIGAVALANALLVVPENAGTVPPGETLSCQPLGDPPDPGPGWHDPRA